jgi:speckle-type POZ protein
MRRAIACVLLVTATARADTTLQTDVGFVWLGWREPGSGVSLRSSAPTPAPATTESVFGVRIGTAVQLDQIRLGGDFTYGDRIATYGAVAEYAPRVGPISLQLGARAAIGMLGPDMDFVGYVNGVLGVRYRFANMMVAQASVEHSIVGTRSYWLGGLFLGVDFPVAEKPKPAPTNDVNARVAALEAEVERARTDIAAANARLDALQAPAAPAPEPAPAPPLPDIVWASSVVGFSSQYGTGSWSAQHALGPPDVFPEGGDRGGAWASRDADGGPEFLELAFGAPRRIRAVEIYETYNPGAVTRVTLVGDAGLRKVLDQDAGKIDAPSYKQRIDFECTDEAYDEVRVDLDSDAVPGWNEIDAVGIVPCD